MTIDLGGLLDSLPTMVWTARRDGTCDFVNRHWANYTGLTLEQALATDWTVIFHPDDLPAALEAWKTTLSAQVPAAIVVQARLRRFDGAYRRFKIETRPLHDSFGELGGWCGIGTDVEDQKRAEALLAAEQRLLELIARSIDLPGVCTVLCRQIEGLVPGALCSVLLLDASGDRVWVGGAPSLPASYSTAMAGLDIDRHTFAHRATFTVATPTSDPPIPSCAAWPGQIGTFGLTTGWTTPILGSSGDLLGVVALYNHGPTREEDLIDRLARIAGLAIERAQADAALVANAAQLQQTRDHLAQAQRLSRTGSFSMNYEAGIQVWSEEVFRILELEQEAAANFDTFRALIHPDDQGLFNETMQVALNTGTDLDVVFRLVTPRGNEKFLHAIAQRAGGATSQLFIGTIQDVTERKLAEESLKASEARLRRANRFLTGAQRLSKTGSFSWVVATDEQDWSEELYRIWERLPAQGYYPHPSLLSIIHPDDLPAVHETVSAALSMGEDYELNYRIITPTGVVKHLRTVNERLAEITDQMVYIGATQDLTEMKLVEEALRRSEAELRRANHFLIGGQRLSKTGSFSLDTSSGEQVWSEENYRIWEFDPTISPTMDLVLDTIHPEDRDSAFQSFAHAAQARESFEMFYRILTPLSGVKYLHTVMEPVPEITDRAVYLGSTQDITESKRVEDVIRASEAELSRAITHLTAAQRISQTGSFSWDVVADQHNWSEVIYRLFGFEPGCKVTMDMMMSVIHPEDIPAVQSLIGGAASGENFELVFRVTPSDGETRYAHVMGQRIDQTDDRPVFMGALQDITARRRSEEELNRAREDLAHVSRVTALSALTASIAHEVNQPLSGILTNASTCVRMLTAASPNIEGAQRTAERIIRDANRTSEVIKRLRSLFTRKPLTLERLDLHEAAREVLSLSSGEMQRRGVIVRTDFAADISVVLADRIQIQQVVMNLILNAADAMVEIFDRPRDLHVSSRLEADDLVTFSVRDCGVGVDAESIERLFHPFHTTKAEGMGIGLSISRSIIEAHGGHISAEGNGVEPGATFSFSIPCASAQASEAPT